MFNNKKKIIYIPIGRGCHTAMHLNILGLRKCSYPMDWLIPSDKNEVMETRFEYLMGNFKGFLEKKDLIPYENKHDTVHKLSVHNQYSDLWFHHDFKDLNKFSKEFKSIKKKYNRRCKRLISDIKQAKEVRLIYMQNTWDHKEEILTTFSDTYLQSLMYRLKSKYPKQNIKLYIFQNDSNMEKLSYQKFKINDNITRFISNHSYTQNDESGAITLSIDKIFKEEIL